MKQKLIKLFCFLGKYIQIGCVKLFLSTRECLPSAVNELTNSPKILHVTKGEFLRLNFLNTDQEI